MSKCHSQLQLLIISVAGENDDLDTGYNTRVFPSFNLLTSCTICVLITLII